MLRYGGCVAEKDNIKKKKDKGNWRLNLSERRKEALVGVT